MVAHLAAQADTPLAFDSPRYTVMQNIDGTVALLEAVRRSGGIEKLLYAGSGNEIGRPLQLPIDESHPLTPHNPYGFSKAAAELAVWSWQRAYGVPAVVLSTGVVIGPRMRREVFIFKWLWNAMHGRPIVVEGGQQTRDLSFIDDVIGPGRWQSRLRPSGWWARSSSLVVARSAPWRSWPNGAGPPSAPTFPSSTWATGPERRASGKPSR